MILIRVKFDNISYATEITNLWILLEKYGDHDDMLLFYFMKKIAHWRTINTC